MVAACRAAMHQLCAWMMRSSGGGALRVWECGGM